MTRSTGVPVLLLASLVLGGCSEAPVAGPLRSLERSGDAAFVCVSSTGEGRDIDSCPDYDGDDDEERSLLALVTQTLRGEVAVIDLSRGSVVDVDPSTPGYAFLPIGAMPGDIVSTPGGVATFVGVAEAGRPGIFALPASCVRAPAVGERTRDLTNWPACALPSPPGQMAILIDRPDADGRLRASCDGAREDIEPPLAATRDVCPADLSQETPHPGRRKLLVTLPDEGQVAIIDAQSLLDREPGSFDPCPVERWVALQVQLPTGAIDQPVPEDLQAEGCAEAPARQSYEPPAGDFVSRPAGIALADGVLYVTDQDAPVIHRLSVADPCSPVELAPLLPLSVEQPSRVVTTRDLAVSPLTTRAERFAYVIDDRGDVMVFDVSPGVADRTPVLRSGSPLLPPDFETPDRLTLDSPVKDVEFVLRDEPQADPVTGVALLGAQCDPDPFNADSLGAGYRPTADYGGGARPRQLRGVFAFLMLASGEVAVVDVEDFDAPCRRPTRANPASGEDTLGCAGDPLEPGVFYTEGGGEADPRTVTGEMSCRVVDQHRSRSSSLILSNSDVGVSGPSLRSLPLLHDDEGSSLVSDDSDDGRKHPKLLAVDHVDPQDPTLTAAVEVNVGTVPYSSLREASNRLDLDPGEAAENSVALIQRQPRAFYPAEEYTATYEGRVVGERPGGLLRLSSDPSQVHLLEDGYARYCDRGVQDEALVREVGERLLPASATAADLDAFVLRHADYVQITAAIPGEDDGYWSHGQSVGYTCGGQGDGNGYVACQGVFGSPDEPGPMRDLRIVEAYRGALLVYPRAAVSADYVDLLYCCFGGGQLLSYVVRAGHQWLVRGSASGFQHDVTTGADDRCVRDCRPLRAMHQGRVFEVATEDQIAAQDAELPQQVCVFPSDPEDGPDPALRLPEPLSPDSECVFQNLTHRFAVYRGREPSARGMRFSWEITGGFRPMSASLRIAGGTTQTSPQAMMYVPQLASLAVTDGAQKGLSFISLDNVSPSFMFY